MPAGFCDSDQQKVTLGWSVDLMDRQKGYRFFVGKTLKEMSVA
jgi:hypothetical protein